LPAETALPVDALGSATAAYGIAGLKSQVSPDVGLMAAVVRVNIFASIGNQNPAD
jgi:hypothetical protein